MWGYTIYYIDSKNKIFCDIHILIEILATSSTLFVIVVEHLAADQSSQLHHLFYRFMHLWSGRNYTLYNVVYMHNHNIVNVALDTRVKLAVKPLFDIDCYLLMLFILTCCLWICSNLREEKTYITRFKIKTIFRRKGKDF